MARRDDEGDAQRHALHGAAPCSSGFSRICNLARIRSRRKDEELSLHVDLGMPRLEERDEARLVRCVGRGGSCDALRRRRQDAEAIALDPLLQALAVAGERAVFGACRPRGFRQLGLGLVGQGQLGSGVAVLALARRQRDRDADAERHHVRVAGALSVRDAPAPVGMALAGSSRPPVASRPRSRDSRPGPMDARRHTRPRSVAAGRAAAARSSLLTPDPSLQGHERGALLLAHLCRLVFGGTARRRQRQHLLAAAGRRRQASSRGLELFVGVVLHERRQLERLAGIEGVDVGECGLQPGLGERGLHLDRLALHRRFGGRASSLALASTSSHSWLMPMRFIVIESRVVLSRSGPVTGRFSMPTLSVGSGSRPAARAVSAALSWPARAARAVSERCTARSSADSRLSDAPVLRAARARRPRRPRK